jgi:tRNA 5-methylaminomethyl-2-thiouridine biosynthesis bifunctional protein
VFAPHVSPDDGVLSRLSRSGVRATLQQAEWLLNDGVDWSPCGVLEHRTDGTPGLAADWMDGPGAHWSQPAPPGRLAEAGLHAETTACWHPQAGWVRPARLALALLAQPGIQWQGDCRVAQLRRTEQTLTAANGEAPNSLWQALDAQGNVVAEAPVVIIAAGAGSLDLLERRWPLQPVRGQVSWGIHTDTAEESVPPFPTNGNGNLVPAFALDDAPNGRQAWVMGSTFERDVDALPPSAADVQAAHTANWAKLQTLLPQVAPLFEPTFAALQGTPNTPNGSDGPPPASALKSWAAVRCTAPDRLPIVGPVDTAQLPGLWVNTAMGARGLTLSLLCGELLAARLQGEPLPLDTKLAKALGTERM